MSDDFIYYAFISYSHKDEKWAKWLQRKLESYRLPTVIRKESGKPLPKRIAPVFLDATDLQVGKLNDNLFNELAESRFLIVICSPNSAKPNKQGKHYVNTEVEHFCALGREDKIIPVIVDGAPDDPERGCFCPKIAELELVGLDATKHSRERILNDVVARILSLRPDELWRREQRRIARQRFLLSLGGVALLALLGAAAYLTCDWYLPHVEYYEDYVDCYGIPVGIGRLTEEQIRPRNFHYRFVYRKRDRLFGRRILREVTHCNSAGTPRGFDEWHSDRPVWQQIEYDTQFQLQYIDILDKTGYHQERRLFSGKGQSVIDFKKKDKGDALVGLFRSSSITDPEKGSKAEIQRWRVDRDAQGRPVRVMFYRDDAAKVPTRDADGIFGMRYEYGAMGRILRKSYLGLNRESISLKNGICAVQYERTEGSAQETDIRWVDAQGKTVKKVAFEYDPNGNLISVSHFIGEAPAYQNGYAKAVFQYDKHGNRITGSYFGIDGKPCLHKDGFAKWTHRYDERGNATEEAYFGIDGKPCLGKEGYAKLIHQYDDCGNVTEEAYFGIDGKPCLGKEGYAKFLLQYDERGNMTEGFFFGIDGKPCLHRDGNARVTWKYDERGNQTEASYFGIDGNPCLIKDGFAKSMRKYDERGNKTEEAYFGINGKPCRCNNGFAKVTAHYDGRGNLTEGSFFGHDGKPCLHKHGYARITSKYDERGNVTEEYYFGIDGKPCLHKDGYAKATRQFDERGNAREVSFFGIDGKPCLSNERIAKITYKYDERGNVTEVSCFGIDGKPCLCKKGFARVTLQYDEQGKLIQVLLFNASGKLIRTVNGE